MSGDYSRQRFDAQRDFGGVLMQQGRVQLDADWNEQVEILDRRWRAETTDIIGRCVVPRVTPFGFLIQLKGGELSIGPGRIYVDGLLAENHGLGTPAFDSVLAELRGPDFVPYKSQPYYRQPAPLPDQGKHLVYIDVWQREVTFLEAPDLIESAVGVDTTARLQTVWQVKVLPNELDATVTCQTPDDQVPGWSELIRPSGGRLTTGIAAAPQEQGPCVLPPTAGFRGLENQLYRVEIHEGGPLGTAKFKWSRDNASVVAAVTQIDANVTLTVDRTGRDEVLRFADGQWIEITDDDRELSGQPGILRQITVDAASRQITLSAPLAAGDGLATTPDEIKKRHTRIRRWDQSGPDVAANNGLVTVPADGSPLELERAVQVTFSVSPVGGEFRAGDYWVFYARAAASAPDESVEKLAAAPPRGVHHHYGRLALATFPDTPPTDCRMHWPPEFDHGCDCTVCVTDESHNTGALTINKAIGQLPDAGGTVCLAAGTYLLRDETVTIAKRRSVRIRGQGLGTQLQYAGGDAAILIEDSRGVTIEQLLVRGAQEGSETRSAIAVQSCQDLTIQNCWLQLRPSRSDRTSCAIELGGSLVTTRIRQNELQAFAGIDVHATTLGLRVEQNLFHCPDRGMTLSPKCLLGGETRLAANTLNRCANGGIVCLGTLIHGTLDVEQNCIQTSGKAIVVGTDNARINNNQIVVLDRGTLNTSGIELVTGANKDGIGHCQVIGNRIADVSGDGIAVRTRLRSAMIKQNVIENIGGGGIVMADESGADSLSIENNQLFNRELVQNTDQRQVAGIRVRNIGQGHIVGNVVKGVGQSLERTTLRIGIDVLAAATAHVSGNEIVDVGPAGSFSGFAVGILVRAPAQRVQVIDNVIRRSASPQADVQSNWIAIAVATPSNPPQRRPEVRGSEPVLDVSVFHALSGAVATLRVEDSLIALAPHAILALRVATTSVLVRGNDVDGYGAGTAIFVFADTCTFTDNRCVLQTVAETVAPHVSIVAGAVIAGSNQIQTQSRGIALALHVNVERCTVLGNIVTGRIQINGVDLGNPWRPLNVL